MRVNHQPAYILLTRPYSETSWIVEIFSREYGRLTLMAKGARRLKSKLKGALLPFQPVLLSWIGKGEMPILTAAEIDQKDYDFITGELKGDGLVCGFYCNELIVNLLHKHDPHPELFDFYHKTVILLSENQQGGLAHSLRDFEQMMMREMGYEVSFEFEADGRTLIEPDAYYYFQPEEGFIKVVKPKKQDQSALNAHDMNTPYNYYDQSYQGPEDYGTHNLRYQSKSIQGRVIQALKKNERDLKPQDLTQSKLLMRDILTQMLGSKKIVSRELFFPKLRR